MRNYFCGPTKRKFKKKNTWPCENKPMNQRNCKNKEKKICNSNVETCINHRLMEL